MISSEHYTLLTIMGILVISLLTTQINPALLFFSAITACFIFGMMELEVLLANFTNLSLITLIMLLMASLAIEKTRLIHWLSGQIAKGSLSHSIARLGLSTAILSSFTNNTAVVATLIHAVKDNPNHPPSKLLLPLSYTAIMGGTLTLIGTSTNLIINGFVQDVGLSPLGFFDFTVIGMCVVGIGISMLIFCSKLLPETQDESPQAVPSFYLEAKVTAESSLIGRSVEDNGLRHLKSIFLAEIIRDGETIVPVCPTEVLRQDDRLFFVGDIASAQKLSNISDLKLIDPEHDPHKNRDNSLVEVVISPSAQIKGKTLKQIRFRERFDAAVVAIRRGHARLAGGLGQIKLQAGDTLILAAGKNFQQHKLSKEFIYVSGLQLKRILSRQQSWAVLASFTLTLSAAITGIFPLEKGLMLLLAGYLVTNIISPQELQERFPLTLFVIVASAIGLAQLMINTGVAGLITTTLLHYINGWGVLGAFITIFISTLILTELITNNAAAALIFPIAYSLALSLNVDPMPFIMAVIFGASASFISPYGYQTNLMVYSAGNYRLCDYLRLGIPTSLAYTITALLMIPIIFPFYP